MKSKAIEILNDNWRDGFTVPSKNLYPYQWKWDSGFIAIGLAHFNMDRAKREINTLLNAQWENGFLPHIVFHTKSENYFPGPEFHRADLHPRASKKYKSTGMTQPPVTGFVLQEINLMIRNLKKWSRPQRVHTPLVHWPAKSFYRSEPYGRVLIISPWNWPLLIPMGIIVPALLSGNAVIFKPSEFTPLTGHKIRDIFIEAGVPEHIFQIVQGGATQGKALINAGVEKIFFTGSTGVGNNIFQQCACLLMKNVLEMGGSDPAIVCGFSATQCACSSFKYI